MRVSRPKQAVRKGGLPRACSWAEGLTSPTHPSVKGHI